MSLLRPPITDSNAPGADIIDKVEWKQVKSTTYLHTYKFKKKSLFIRKFSVFFDIQLFSNDIKFERKFYEIKTSAAF